MLYARWLPVCDKNHAYTAVTVHGIGAQAIDSFCCDRTRVLFVVEQLSCSSCSVCLFNRRLAYQHELSTIEGHLEEHCLPLPAEFTQL